MPDWTILSTHGLVLVALARKPTARIRDIAELVGLTERAVQTLVNDLVEAGYLERTREGRRNRYIVRGDMHFPHPSVQEHAIAALLDALVVSPAARPTGESCDAIVLACSDFRFQGPLRSLLAVEGLLGRAEVVLVPGGAAALGSRDAGELLDELRGLAAERGAGRLLLVAHQGCAGPGAFVRRGPDPVAAWRRVQARRGRVADRVRRRLGLEPEMWFLDRRGSRRVRHRASNAS